MTIREDLTKNLAIDMDQQVLDDIANTIVKDYDCDISDREKWENNAKKWVKMWACDVSDRKPPYKDASNVCMPLFASAENQTHSRLYTSIVNTPNMYSILPVEENDLERSNKVEKFMNYQLLNEIDNYEESLDIALQRTTIYGICFRKIFWDDSIEKISVISISPFDIVVPSNTIDFRRLERLTHRVVFSPTELQGKFDDGEFIGMDNLDENEEDINKLTTNISGDISKGREAANEIAGLEENLTTNEEHDILICQKKIKLEGDVKRQPYTIIIHRFNRKVLSITSRLMKDGDGKDVELKNYVAYHFIPNPEGFYSIGLGLYQHQLNEVINSAYNQQFDAGSFRNMPFGFYSSRFGRRNRNKIMISPGAMNEVDDPNAVNFPRMQPGDSTLFNLITLATQFSDKLTANSDLLSGIQSPGSRETARGTLALIEQGLANFSTISKRIYVSLREEGQIIYILNSIYLKKERQFRISGNKDKLKLPWPKIKRKDFSGVLDLKILADPKFANQALVLQKAIDFATIVGTNPLILGDKAGLPPNRKAQLQLLKDLLEAFEKDPSLYLPDDILNRPLDPVNENTRMAQGDEVSISPQDDDEAHNEVHRTFLNGEFGVDLKSENKDKIIEHMQTHIKQLNVKVNQTVLNENQGGENVNIRG